MDRHRPGVAVAAWIGSTNLGDELVFAALKAKLAARQVPVTAISIAPAATRAAHGVDAVGARPPAVVAATRAARSLVLGGGGLLQDETSHLNLPYHLARVVAARAQGRPFAAVGIGAGPLHTRAARWMVASTLRAAVATSVRDSDSAEVLAAVGAPPPVVAADLAVSLPRPQVEARDRIVVCLRSWGAGPSFLPVARRRTPEPAPAWFVEGMAAALDACAGRTGLAVHMVAFQADRDDRVHRLVADRMRAPVTLSSPAVGTVAAEVASGRVVVSMRYHGGICAALGGRPAVLIGYSRKVPALAHDLGPAATTLRWTPSEVERLPGAVDAVLDRDDAMRESLERLRARERGNDIVLERLLGS